MLVLLQKKMRCKIVWYGVGLALLMACQEQERKCDTATLHLAGIIEGLSQDEMYFHVDGDKSRLVEVSFYKNRARDIKIWYAIGSAQPDEEYVLEHTNQNLASVQYYQYNKEGNRLARVIPVKDFTFSLGVRSPALAYTTDSVIRNKVQDITGMFFLDDQRRVIKTYEIYYQYDSVGNWIRRRVYDDGVLWEEAKRTIHYGTKITPEAIQLWTVLVDSVFEDHIRWMKKFKKEIPAMPENVRIAADVQTSVAKQYTPIKEWYLQTDSIVRQFKNAYGQDNTLECYIQLRTRMSLLAKLAYTDYGLLQELREVALVLADPSGENLAAYKQFHDRDVMDDARQLLVRIDSLEQAFRDLRDTQN